MDVEAKESQQTKMPAELEKKVVHQCKTYYGISPWNVLVQRLCIDVLLFYPLYRLYNRLIIMPLGAILNLYKYLPEWKNKPALKKQNLPVPQVIDLGSQQSPTPLPQPKKSDISKGKQQLERRRRRLPPVAYQLNRRSRSSVMLQYPPA